MSTLLDLIRTKLPDIDFQYEFVDIASYPTVYKTQMAAGEGPDMLADERPNPSGVDNGYALDLSSFGFVQKYTEAGINELSFGDKVYAVPGPSWFGGYFYNKAMFAEHGWKIPATYDEFIELCGKIEAAGIKPIANPIKNPNYLMHYAISYVLPEFLAKPENQSWDKDFAAGKVKMADTWLPYMEKWAEVVTKGYVTAEDLGMDAAQAIDEFALGKAAMLDSGPWDVETIMAKNPNMQLDMMPYVGNSGGTGWLFGGPGVRWGINSQLGRPENKAKLDACVRIIDLITSPEGQKAYWENNKGGSSYVKGVTLDMPAEYDGCKEVFAAGNVYGPWMMWNDGVYQEFGSQLQGYVAGTVTLKQVLEATDAKNEEILTKLRDAL
jgi:raffinose/stachyose/melibiose transport system substrate-binding protein